MISGGVTMNHVVLELRSPLTYNRNSALLLRNKYIITPLATYARVLDAGDVLFGEMAKSLAIDGFYAFSAKQGKAAESLRASVCGQNEIEIPVEAISIFSPKAIRNACQDLLRWDLTVPNLRTLPRNDQMVLLSSFLLIIIGSGGIGSEFKKFHWKTKLHAEDCHVLATPYGNSMMMGSVIPCRMANQLRGVLAVLDVPLIAGSEGGLFLRPGGLLTGMVMATTFLKADDNVYLSLVANLEVILRDNCLVNESAVVIESGRDSFGSGSLVKVGNRNLVLTNRHVIVDDQTNRCTWNSKVFRLNLIYKNPSEEPYDLAIFEAPDGIPDYAYAPLAEQRPIIGDKIKSIGFPIFDPKLIRDHRVQPSIFHGAVINYRPGLMMTNLMIQTGHSGGPVLDMNGNVIGIATLNVRDVETKHIFPTVNCAIPIFDIKPVLERFAQTNDRQVLNELGEQEALNPVWSLEEKSILSKL